MFANLGLGTLIVSITVFIHTIGLIFVTRAISSINIWFRLHRHDFGRTMSMVTIVLSLFGVHSVEIWLWAFVYEGLGAIRAFEDALYFSTVTFSTVGYGDVLLPERWRLLGALEGINGFLLIGWSTAYLVAAATRHGPFRAGEHF